MANCGKMPTAPMTARSSGVGASAWSPPDRLPSSSIRTSSGMWPRQNRSKIRARRSADASASRTTRAATSASAWDIAPIRR